MKYKSASEILLTGVTPELVRDIADERLNIECARFVYDLRKRMGLTQKQLAEKVGTSQAAIARLEDSDSGVRTIQMMDRIGKVLGFRLTFTIVETDDNGTEVKRDSQGCGADPKQKPPAQIRQDRSRDARQSRNAHPQPNDAANNNYAYAA